MPRRYVHSLDVLGQSTEIMTGSGFDLILSCCFDVSCK
jgi:hypothetical protein